MKSKSNVKDFFLNLGATISLYTVVGSLVTLLFSVINKAYPQITNGYYYFGSSSISWPVSILAIFFPIFILLMWLLAKDYDSDPERKNAGVHKWLTFLTLFIAGVALAIDLITVLYYFIDGQELTTGFILKVLVLLVITGGVFTYYISDIRGKLTPKSRNMWRIFAFVIVLGSIVWGFSVLGSPRTQRLYKYDQQKLSDLQNLNSQVQTYYATNSKLPNNVDELKAAAYYGSMVDPQSQKPYEYVKTGTLTYSLCAEFNKASDEQLTNNQAYPYYGDVIWTHPAGRHCFEQKINTAMYPKPLGY
ncbi:MAG: hypothetical protein CEO12_139 [Parcubacteria group bacterium Gr01-1014_46]|nr:MAG: hypothetical protein CEO12_139 [Parcubacteria group bacterium Gr01-1014_46]